MDDPGDVLRRLALHRIAPVAARLAVSASVALAAKGDCGQPVSSRDGPVACDCQHVRQAGIGSADGELCVCEINANAATTTGDALDLAGQFPFVGICLGQDPLE